MPNKVAPGGANSNKPSKRVETKPAGDHTLPTVQWETACFIMPEPSESVVKKRSGAVGRRHLISQHTFRCHPLVSPRPTPQPRILSFRRHACVHTHVRLHASRPAADAENGDSVLVENSDCKTEVGLVRLGPDKGRVSLQYQTVKMSATPGKHYRSVSHMHHTDVNFRV